MTVDPSRTQWFKSSYSGSQNECVEIAWLAEGLVGVRDSKNPDGPALTFTPGAWNAFTAVVKLARRSDQ
ncbi:DUF397 domain-containing protein [Nocardia vinacea]|uniref:DUF397 domain-containing protein n=1 Tax=Nocardia vinacea TaxID=96468 RepID=UPI002E13F5C8|nr:DUF397 domain-containing protein [Nocardia vinacea]